MIIMMIITMMMIILFHRIAYSANPQNTGTESEKNLWGRVVVEDDGVCEASPLHRVGRKERWPSSAVKPGRGGGRGGVSAGGPPMGCGVKRDESGNRLHARRNPRSNVRTRRAWVDCGISLCLSMACALFGCAS